MFKELGQLAGFTKPSTHAAERLGICQGCKFHTKHLGRVWCGTPIMGDTVQVQGQVKKLCGCNMDEKTKLDDSKCSIGIW